MIHIYFLKAQNMVSAEILLNHPLSDRSQWKAAPRQCSALQASHEEAKTSSRDNAAFRGRLGAAAASHGPGGLGPGLEAWRVRAKR